MNPDIAKERENCPFDVEELAALMNGGKHELQIKRKIHKYFYEEKVIEVIIFNKYNVINVIL